ncbi:AraC family transcriptional regulator [soil metagenome]
MSLGAKEEGFIPAIHALPLAEVTARYGVSCAQLLVGTRLTEADLTDPEERIATAIVEVLVQRARTLTGEPALGLLVGLQMRISAHGYLGFAAMVAGTIGEALEIAVRFAPTRTNALTLRLAPVASDRVALVIEERVSFGTASDVVLFALIEGIRQIGQALTGTTLSGSAEVTFAEPPYFAKLKKLAAPGAIRFGRAENRILFDRAILDVPLVMADPSAFRLASEQCERALGALRDASRVTTKVRSLVARRGGLERSLDDVASSLHVSSRTLKRHLAAEGTTFKALLDDARQGEALRLVRSTNVSLDEIASLLGYSDVANFTRAFRRWTGKTPGAERRDAMRA